MVRYTFLLLVYLGQCMSVFGVDDPVSVSLDGVSISSIPDMVFISSDDPGAEWKEFIERPGFAAMDDRFEREHGVFSASRNGLIYQIMEPSVLKEIVGEFAAPVSPGTIIYCWTSIDRRTRAEWTAEHQLSPVQGFNEHRRDGQLFQASEDRFVWFIDAARFKSCPMHPHFFVGRTDRCQICEMSKLPIGQIPK